MGLRRQIIFPLAAAALSSCSLLGQDTSRILGQLSGRDMTALNGATKGHPAARMCGLAMSDGAIRMMAKGDIAVVDINGRPRLLSLRNAGSAGVTYEDDGTEVAVSFVADLLSDSGAVIGHRAGILVKLRNDAEHFYATWDC